ncbi:translation initiation factor [Vitiosangium sp. GDMCC 1.1324]|uniref:translation initiation factor n=1 Tax=Vitiosangium sp. (strain GDMCC 1.1324) TaxID=2138576 RepID=UPI000D334D4C|nr:translation initiation factor [Vitiosangium sp. GDMCC 1.1324]PTL82881.1 translation initiation factor [Vitiosangium sp. GDMCC 1.1324]
MAKQTRGGRDGARPEETAQGEGPEPRQAPKVKGFNSPFARLEALRETLPSTQPQVRPEDFPGTPPPQGPERAVVRLEPGRGGQEVTVVEGLGLPSAELQAWLQALRRGLACTGTVEGERLVLQGDHRFKVPDLLLRRGVKRVVHG